MYKVYKRWSPRWFPWLNNNAWVFLADFDTKEAAEEYIESSNNAYEYKIEYVKQP